MPEVLEQLNEPPIVEVVCGVSFQAIPQLDPILLGTFWARKKDAYPIRQLQPALVGDSAVFLPFIPPLRVWLVSQNNVFVLQVQQDRFYLNWRAQGEEYPRFGDHDGRRGLLSLFLEELSDLSAFCKETLNADPIIQSIELAKVDHLVQGLHWDSFAELGVIIPWLGHLCEFSESGSPDVSLQFSENRKLGKLAVAIGTGVVAGSGGKPRKILTMESRISGPITMDLRRLFEEANKDLNRVFAQMIPSEERKKRFMAKKEGV